MTDNQQSYFDQSPALKYTTDGAILYYSATLAKFGSLATHPLARNAINVYSAVSTNSISTTVNMTAGGDSLGEASLKVAANIGCIVTLSPIAGVACGYIASELIELAFDELNSGSSLSSQEIAIQRQNYLDQLQSQEGQGAACLVNENGGFDLFIKNENGDIQQTTIPEFQQNADLSSIPEDFSMDIKETSVTNTFTAEDGTQTQVSESFSTSNGDQKSQLDNIGLR